MYPMNYKKGNQFNFDNKVNIYVPRYSHIEIESIKDDNIYSFEFYDISLAIPLVLSVVSTILGENREIQFTRYLNSK